MGWGANHARPCEQTSGQYRAIGERRNPLINREFCESRIRQRSCAALCVSRSSPPGKQDWSVDRAKRTEIGESRVCSSATHGSPKNDHHRSSELSRVVCRVFRAMSRRVPPRVRRRHTIINTERLSQLPICAAPRHRTTF
jgi:hypothetical protein